MRILISCAGIAIAVFALALAQEAPSGTPDFDAWVAALRTEALGRKISPETLDRALADLEPIERVIELDRDQPELTLTLQKYLGLYITDKRVARGREALRKHHDLIERVGKRYGVQPRFLVALWGVESNYGEETGSFPVVGSLATLAFEGRRAAFFRGELLDALVILDEGHITPERMRGSWAGAMGQPQFMPSSFRRMAVDFDGDGRRDIWSDTDDVLASIGNYLATNGWDDDQTWGREVRLPAKFNPALVGRKVSKTLGEWQRLGVRRVDGSALPKVALHGSIIRPDPARAFLVYGNFRTILRWNSSDFFGVAVGTLADRIGER